MLTRRLTLEKETLAPLDADELTAVVGGPGTHVTCYTCVIGDCKPVIAIHHSIQAPTECCQGIPTFHGMAC